MLKLFSPVLLGIFFMASISGQAKPKFIASDVAGKSSDLMLCDLDGDGLKDLVLLNHLDLTIFYQDAKRGFTRELQKSHQLQSLQCVIWATKLGRNSESLLVMTSDGVSELSFTNRAGPPALQQIIRQPTIVPDTAEGTNVMQLPLTVGTGHDWPLLLVPGADGLHVWRHQEKWVQSQVIGHSIDARQWPSLESPGYVTSLGFDFSVGDVNGDMLDDLIVRRGNVGQTKTYNLYLQSTNGLFDSDPALTYPHKAEPGSWICWADLNRDGKVDLIKNVGMKEPSFVPGVPSAKVLVGTYIADAHGKIPAEPQQVFRKNDFTVGLPVVDVDGDRFLDLVLFHRHMENREDVAKAITSKQLVYTLRFYFYRPGGAFPKEADCHRDVSFQLNRGELLGWIGSENYDLYIKLAGDLSGDGKTDLLVREHDDDISVYFFVSRENGFSLKPDLKFSCPEQIEEWKVNDLNKDGVGDLIVKLRKQNTFRIFISQK